MNISINFWVIFLLIGLRLRSVTCDRLTVVTTEPVEFLHAHYREVWKKGPAPEWDPAKTNGAARLRICEHINNSGLFSTRQLNDDYQPVDVRELASDSKNSQYSNLFREAYGVSPGSEQSNDPHTRINPLALRKFEFYTFLTDESGVHQFSIDKDEHVFPCFLRRTDSDDIAAYYVSKLYDLLQGIRFIFVESPPSNVRSLVFLAEKSSTAYLRADFSVELHYLEMRKYHNMAESFDLDPVCKLNDKKIERDQSFRLCTIVLGSSHYKLELLYERASWSSMRRCVETRISFKTRDGLEAASQNQKKYKERLLSCVAVVDKKVRWYYISRAYNPNEVFVYTDGQNGIYLETLMKDVSLVKEPYNFGEVEI